MSPSMLNNPSLNEINRLRDEIVSQNAKQMQWEDRIMQASKACQAWKSEADESNRKVKCSHITRIICISFKFVLIYWYCILS